MPKIEIITTARELQQRLEAARKQRESVALVPTMGALHEGHLSLIANAVRENALTVVSIFVNPTQFNDPKDYESYPRTLEADLQKLEKYAPLVIFTPTTEDVYAVPLPESFDFSPLDSVMEGKNRPGHFHGVGQIVGRLFQMVKPQRAYFGEKDYQQLLIVRRLAELLELPIEVVGCPIVREPSGLALSSRNALLSAEQRETAANIYRILKVSGDTLRERGIGATEQWVTDRINAIEGFECEYFTIADANSLEPAEEGANPEGIMGFVVVRVGSVRLIDNIHY